MPIFTDLYIDRIGNKLVTSLTDASPSPFGSRIIEDDSLYFRVYLLERTINYYAPVANGNPLFTIINNANLSLLMAIGTQKGDTIYTDQFTWTKSDANTYFEAALPLNTLAIQNYISGNNSFPLSPWLQITFTEVGGYRFTPLQMTISLFPDVVGQAGTSVPAPLVPISAQEVAAEFVANESLGFILTDRTTGQKFDVYMDNGELHKDPIAP